MSVKFSRNRHTIITIPYEEGAKPCIYGFNHNLNHIDFGEQADKIIYETPWEIINNPVGFFAVDLEPKKHYTPCSKYLGINDLIKKLIVKHRAWVCYQDIPTGNPNNVPENKNICIVNELGIHKMYGNVVIKVQSTNPIICKILENGTKVIDPIWMPLI